MKPFTTLQIHPIMKNSFILFLLCLSTSLSAQKIELIQGIHVNKFIGTYNNPSYQNSFTPHSGYNIRFAYESPKTKKMSWRLAIGYQKYSSDFRTGDGGHGGGFYVQAKIDKSVVSFIIYPLNLTFWDKLNINLGFAFSTTISNSYDGVRTHWTLTEPSTTDDLHDLYETYNSFGHFGLTGRLAYDFKLSSKMTLSPQYAYYYGISSEFQQFPSDARTMRHYYCVGIGWKL